MKIKTSSVAALVAILASVVGCSEQIAKKEAPKYRLSQLSRTDIVKTVEATGTVAPIKKVEVGAQVNGKIVKLFVDYNSVVTNGQVVALIDPQVYDAQYKSSLAQLHANQANVKKCEAVLALAEKTLVRKAALSKKQLASVADYDQALEARDTAAASLAQAKAQVEQSEASVSQTRANLAYCTIVSPVDGIVIVRSVDEGQTVVSSMNAVPLLTIAENLKRIQVEATVPEADVGSIREGQRVSFTADAYRKRFKGTVKQVRLAATTLNNVVTYPIVIEADNDDPDAMLFPGMTANISVETARAENVLAVASSAFRFRPNEADYKAAAEAAGGKIPRGRKLWFVKDDGSLEFVMVEDGVSDASFTEVKGADAFAGRDAVIGYQTARTIAAGGGVNNPFKPKFPQRNKNKGTAPEPRRR
jgi:HlyD family secretion protein